MQYAILRIYALRSVSFLIIFGIGFIPFSITWGGFKFLNPKSHYQSQILA